MAVNRPVNVDDGKEVMVTLSAVIHQKHDQAIREVTQFMIDKYYPDQILTPEEKQDIARHVAESFDAYASVLYKYKAYEVFQFESTICILFFLKMSKSQFSIEELLDTIDDLDDSIQYIREMVQSIFWDQIEFVDDVDEEEEEQPDKEAPQEPVEEKSEEKTEK